MTPTQLEPSLPILYCFHNRMVENTNLKTGQPDPIYAWKCADCGYVYGADFQVYLKEFPHLDPRD